MDGGEFSMKRILLDTNIYGRLIEDPLLFEKLTLLVPDTYVIYGTSLIRKELRDVSAHLTFDGKNKRIILLQAYNSFVRKENHNLEITMLSEKAKRAYAEVNRVYQFRSPLFYVYEQFKEEVRRVLNDHDQSSI